MIRAAAVSVPPLRWLAALVCVVLGAVLLAFAFGTLFAGPGLWSLLAAVGATAVLWLGVRCRPAGPSLPRDPKPPWDMSPDDGDLRDAIRLFGFGLGIFLTPFLGLFALAFVAIGYCLGAPGLAYLGLGALVAGPLIVAASFVFIRR